MCNCLEKHIMWNGIILPEYQYKPFVYLIHFTESIFKLRIIFYSHTCFKLLSDEMYIYSTKFWLWYILSFCLKTNHWFKPVFKYESSFGPA